MLDFIRKLFGGRPHRIVVLTMHSGDLAFAIAHKSSMGIYRAKWLDLASCWVILLEGGKVRGDKLVVSWEPYENWDGDEFEFLKKGGGDA